MPALGRVHPARMTAAWHHIVAVLFKQRLLIAHVLTVGARSTVVKV
jgi:hypothetical protein